MGDLAAARTHLEAVLREARRGGDADNVARGLNNLASVAHATGDLAEARRLYEQCRAAFEERGDRTGAAWAINQGGDVARDAGDRAERARSTTRACASSGRPATWTESPPPSLISPAGPRGRRPRPGAGLLQAGARRSARSAGARWCAWSKSWPRWPRHGRRPSAPSSCSRPRPGCATGSAGPPRLQTPWMWRMIEDQRALVGRAASAAWSRGWHMSAEQVMGYASEGA
jgi:hypothetical protein